MKKSVFGAIVIAACILSGCSNDSEGMITGGDSGTKESSSATSSKCPGVNLKTDDKNCGKCNNRCELGAQCISGKCQDMTESECQGANLNTDSDNCGDCGNVCSKNYQCVLGKCVKNDDTAGIDLNKDSANCGKIGKSCSSEQLCVDGVCVINAACTNATSMKTDKNNCGSCGNVCGENSSCTDGKCVCEEGYVDCDGNGSCETEGECECEIGYTEPCYTGAMGTEGVGSCHGGYYACVASDVFGAVMDYSTCVGEVVPKHEFTCSSPTSDDDCNGIPDYQQDEDGDGYPVCKDGHVYDCCDSSKMCNTSRPDLVNPGKMVDCNGNAIDDDCDGFLDEDVKVDCGVPGLECDPTIDPSCPGLCDMIVDRSCSKPNEYPFATSINDIVKGSGMGMVTYNSTQADPAQAGLALLHAMDACVGQVSKESGQAGLIEYSVMGGKKKSGVEERAWLGQINVLSGMYGKNGAKIEPRAGSTFAVLSTGIALDGMSGVTNDMIWEPSVDYKTDMMGNMSLNNSSDYLLPEPYSTAHKGVLQSHKSCKTSSDIFNPVHLHMKMRAPSTAYSVQFDFRFFTQEYPAFVCTPYNDFFVVLLTDENGKSLDDSQPDGNISFDEGGNPISVNNSFFTTCAPYYCGSSPYAMSACKSNSSCDMSTQICVNKCSDGYNDLYAYTNTPYTGSRDTCNVCFYNAKSEIICTNYPCSSNMDDYAFWGTYVLGENKGGGTAWLTTKAPVKPGEVFNIDFYLWDTGDAIYDSTVILDNFQWGCDDSLSRAGTDFAPPIINIQ